MYSPAPPPQRRIVRSAPRWHLSACRESPRAARRQVVATLTTWDLENLVDDAALVISELVTNAATHGLGPIWHRLATVTLDDATTAVHMVVGDSGPGWRGREPGRATSRDTSGRGLDIVDALAALWGAAHTAAGHQVWAELPTPTTRLREPGRARPGGRIAADREPVQGVGTGCAA